MKSPWLYIFVASNKLSVIIILRYSVIAQSALRPCVLFNIGKIYINTLAESYIYAGVTICCNTYDKQTSPCEWKTTRCRSPHTYRNKRPQKMPGRRKERRKIPRRWSTYSGSFSVSVVNCGEALLIMSLSWRRWIVIFPLSLSFFFFVPSHCHGLTDARINYGSWRYVCVIVWIVVMSVGRASRVNLLGNIPQLHL